MSEKNTPKYVISIKVETDEPNYPVELVIPHIQELLKFAANAETKLEIDHLTPFEMSKEVEENGVSFKVIVQFNATKPYSITLSAGTHEPGIGMIYGTCELSRLDMDLPFDPNFDIENPFYFNRIKVSPEGILKVTKK